MCGSLKGVVELRGVRGASNRELSRTLYGKVAKLSEALKNRDLICEFPEQKARPEKY